MKIKVFIVVIILFAVGAFFRPALAQTPAQEGFNQNFIISDDSLLDFARMTQDQIQGFLVAWGSPLATFSDTSVINNVTETAAQIIYEEAQLNQINPQFILVTLDKEESLIRGKYTGTELQNRLDAAMGYYFCDSCTRADVAAAGFLGFAKQVHGAAGSVRRQLTNLQSSGHTTTGYGPGITKKLDCFNYEKNYGLCPVAGTANSPITPANYVTSILYTYTPHFHGNYNFWKYWTTFNFSFQRFYPDGSILRAQGQKSIYLVTFGQLRKFKNDAVFLSMYTNANIITVPADHLIPYPRGKDIIYPNFSLLAQPKGGVYLLVDDVKRPITSGAVFKAAGFQSSEVIKTTWDDLNQFPDGAPLTINDIYPSGMLFQHKTKGYVVFVKDGIAQAILNSQIYKNQFGQRKPMRISGTELAKYKKGKPVGFKDGSLIQGKTDPTTYFISDGYRLPIASSAVFNSYHFEAKNIIHTSDAAVDVHPLGPPLDSTSTVQSASVH